MKNKIHLSGHHMEITEAIREHVEIQLKKELEHYAEQIQDITVKLHVESGDQHVADIHLKTKGHSYHAKSALTDMYASIDKAVAEILVQLKKEHDKQASHRDVSVKKMPTDQ